MSAWVSYAPGIWRHRPWFKLAINTVLRFFQTRKRPARLLVLATIVETRRRGNVESDERPRVKGYEFRRVLHI